MAIGRVPGAALLGNLDRQGLDLGFTTNSDTLLQLDFTNFRLGINTASPQESLEVTGNILVTTGNILTSANLTYDIGATNKYWRNIYSGNLYTSNITSTNITGTLTTAIQTNITTVGTLGNLSVTGNIDAGNIISNITGNVIGSATTVTASAQPNITSLGILTALDVTGNVGAGNVSGTYLTGTLLTQAQPYITSTGILTALDVTGNVGAGNVSGTYLTGTLLTSAQPNITTLSGVTSIGASGSTVLTGTLATNAQPNVTSLGTLISLDVTGNVGAGNVSGTYLTGTLLTASQTNVTSLGTLSALTVSGNIIAQSSIVPTSNIAGNIGYADTWWSAVYANTINATNLNGTILTTNQPYISNLGNITVDSISIGGNISITGNVNGTDITANTITANTITGTLLTGNQPNITNLSNISVDSISISGNLGITGTTTAGIINADEIYESNIRVVTQETTITVTGDATGSGNVSNIALTLADTGVTAGTYGAADDETWDRIPKITVDSKGRITNIANITLTQVGNVTFTDTTISTVANLTIAPTNGYIFANSSVISDVADPVSAQDVVTLNYLTTTLSGAANSLVIGDSLVNLIDETNNSRLEITLDSELIANITANASTFYNTVNIGNISIVDNTISSSGNIYIDAQNTGIVQIVGSDALGIPVGNVITRPLNPEIGYIRFNTDNDAVEYWTGAEWTYPGAATITSETVYPDGLTASYNLTTSATPDGLLVSINGTMQQPFTSYNMSGNVITFTETPQDTDIIEIRHIVAGAVSIGSLTYGPTSKVELSTGNVNITGNLIPTANVTYDLGSDSMWWRDLYMSGSTIHIGGALLKVVDNALSFTPAGSPTPINLTSDVDPTILIANTTQVKATDDFVNVSIAGGNVGKFGSDGLTITGNVSADYIIGDGSQLTGLPAGYTDTNVAAYLPSYTGNISSLTTANTAMKGYVDEQITTVTNSVTGANAAIVTANTAMKDYVDAANTIQSNEITAISNSVTGANTAIVTANTAMKGYVDAINSTLTANAGAQAGTLATIQNNYAQLSGATFTGALAAPNISLTSALAISSGGTGGTSTSSALNNLLPSGEVSGYVLKTAGEGSYYWSAETGGGSVVGTTISTSRTYFTATSGQTVYTGITYTPGAGQLRIYINGVRQFDSAYTETNSSAVTLSTGVTSGTVVLAEVDAYTDYNVYANATYSSPVGTISSTTVQDALAELDTEKAALAGAAFTGNVSTSGNLRVTDTTQSTGEGTGALVVSGGASFSGNVYISGNLQVAGTETIFNANNLSIADSLIYLADDNSGDVLDIGIVSSFTNPGYQHTGFVRDATDGVWKLFANVAAEPTTTIDFTNATYSNLRIGNLTSIGGTFTGNVGADNLSATNLTGTLTTAAQTNVTSVGTLTGLTVSGAPVPNANVSVNLGSTSAWWSILYANTHVGSTATFYGNITAGNVSATNLVGAITSSQVTTALGFTPYNSTNPSGYLTGITSGQVTTALGYTPYNSTNPNGYISAVPNSSTQVSSLGVGTAASGTSGEIRATNNITAYYSSDSRLKENVRDIPDALAKVTAIGGKLFDWTDEYIADHGGLDDYFMRKADFGVIAQDVEQVLPEAVRTREDGYLAVDYEKMCALAFAAIKELQQQVHLLEQQIKDK
jgi:hypothetical protein